MTFLRFIDLPLQRDSSTARPENLSIPSIRLGLNRS